MGRIFFLILGIVFLAGVLRFWHLGNVPPSPDWDEAALGYNAYSILLTGKDEYGKHLPVILRSFDDYKPALYAYFVVPFISIFGLNIEAVRFPSAFFGVLTVLGTFFLTRELFKRNDLALLSLFLLAISPWHIQFSRIAFEANLGVAFNIFAVLFFILGLKRPVLLIISALLAGINIYIYQGEKVFTPLLFLSLVIIFRKELFSKPFKYILASIMLGILVVLPMIFYILTNKEALGRARGVSILAEPYPHQLAKRALEDSKKRDFLGFVFDNRRVVFTKNILSGYLSHFDANWLFVRGDIARHHAPNMGLLYLFELPFLLLGIYYLAFGRFEKKAKFLIFSWFFIAPISASITSGVPHAVRTLNFLPTFQIFVAIGIFSAWLFIQRFKTLKFGVSGILLLIFIFNFLYYLNQYFSQQNYFHSQDWQYGYEEAVEKVKEIEGKYKKIIVSNQPHLDQSYMFFLFYLKYPPSMYQQEAKSASGGFAETHRFGKFEFRPINWTIESKERGILYIGRPFDFPQNDLGHVKTVYFLDGSPAIKFVEGL